MMEKRTWYTWIWANYNKPRPRSPQTVVKSTGNPPPPNARNHSSFFFFRNFCRKSAPNVWWFVAFNDFSLFPPSCWNREIIQSLSSTGRTSTGYLTNETMDWPFRLENLRALRGKEVSYWGWDTLIEQFDIIVTCFCWYLIMIMVMM